MGIDRIGPTGTPPTPEPTNEGAATDPTGRPFEVAATRAPAADSPSVRSERTQTAPGAFDRFRRGDLDLDGYLDLKVQEATGHLSSLPEAELEAIRSSLRERMASDPTLVSLARTAGEGAHERSRNG